jgi:hypothetical protein
MFSVAMTALSAIVHFAHRASSRGKRHEHHSRQGVSLFESLSQIETVCKSLGAIDTTLLSFIILIPFTIKLTSPLLHP